jgi:hypothetical protein
VLRVENVPEDGIFSLREIPYAVFDCSVSAIYERKWADARHPTCTLEMSLCHTTALRGNDGQTRKMAHLR